MLPFPMFFSLSLEGFYAESRRAASSRRATRGRVTNRSPLGILSVPCHQSPVAGSTPSLPPVRSHQAQITKSCRIRTYVKRAGNSRRICTSKTQDLKLFRMNTYKKTGRGAPTQNLAHPFSWPAEARFVPGHSNLPSRKITPRLLAISQRSPLTDPF